MEAVFAVCDELKQFEQHFGLDDQDAKRLFQSTVHPGNIYKIRDLACDNEFEGAATIKRTAKVIYQTYKDGEAKGLVWTADLKYFYNPSNPDTVRFVPFVEEIPADTLPNPQ